MFCFNAGCGDAFRIEFIGNSRVTRHILIDSGYERTYRNVLAADFEMIAKKGQQIDLCIASHIHDDHIGGLKSYINAILANRANNIITQWWFNPPRVSYGLPVNFVLNSVAQSIGQSDLIAGYLNDNNLLPKNPILNNIEPYFLDGMEIHVLSPNSHILDILADKYRDPKIALETIEDKTISHAIGSKNRDYHIPLEEFTFSGWKEDRNLENGGSIAMLTSFRGKNILWLADAHPSVVISSLKAIGYSESNPVECEYVKIAHHGSLGNNSRELYQMIRCHKYILSTSGHNLHGLPSKACLAQILTNSKRTINDHYTFYFTSDDDILRSIFDVDGNTVFERFNFEVIYPLNKIGFEIQI